MENLYPYAPLSIITYFLMKSFYYWVKHILWIKKANHLKNFTNEQCLILSLYQNDSKTDETVKEVAELTKSLGNSAG